MRIAYCVLLIVMCVFMTLSYASHINAPPVLPDMPIELTSYLQEIYNKSGIFSVTDTAPNGTRRGKKGEAVYYNNSGTFELWVNTDSDTTWQKI